MLPIAQYRQAILDGIRAHQVCIISGDTGSGKSTQVGKYILEEHERPSSQGFFSFARLKIACTQPRRLAATSIASRVAQERGETVGQAVGYSIGRSKVVNAATRLVFMTAGVLLKQLVHSDDFCGYTHVVLDEVHERDVDVDFVLCLIKDRLRRHPDVRVVLMSATMDTSLFRDYFSSAFLPKEPDPNNPLLSRQARTWGKQRSQAQAATYASDPSCGWDLTDNDSGTPNGCSRTHSDSASGWGEGNDAGAAAPSGSLPGNAVSEEDPWDKALREMELDRAAGRASTSAGTVGTAQGGGWSGWGPEPDEQQRSSGSDVPAERDVIVVTVGAEGAGTAQGQGTSESAGRGSAGPARERGRARDITDGARSWGRSRSRSRGGDAVPPPTLVPVGVTSRSRWHVVGVVTGSSETDIHADGGDGPGPAPSGEEAAGEGGQSQSQSRSPSEPMVLDLNVLPSDQPAAGTPGGALCASARSGESSVDVEAEGRGSGQEVDPGPAAKRCRGVQLHDQVNVQVGDLGTGQVSALVEDWEDMAVEQSGEGSARGHDNCTHSSGEPSGEPSGGPSAETSADLLGVHSGHRTKQVFMLEIEGRCYPVDVRYLAQLNNTLESLLGPAEQGVCRELKWPGISRPIIDRSMYSFAALLILNISAVAGRFDVAAGQRPAVPGTTVLVFLPGVGEIQDMTDALRERDRSNTLWILPLMSTVADEDQSKVFQKAPPGQQKVILATNIAESSITVPDVAYVVDFGLQKETYYDNVTRTEGLRTTWCSKAAAKQRRGRCGRVGHGYCFCLYDETVYESMDQLITPEMLRCPLERLVLHIKVLSASLEPGDLLRRALQPPPDLAIDTAVQVLQEAAALTAGTEESPTGQLTKIGRYFENLPVDFHLSRLLLLAEAFNCVEEALMLVAALAQRSIFNIPLEHMLEAYGCKLGWAQETESDALASVFAYQEWQTLRRQGRQHARWAYDNFLSLKSLREMEDMLSDLRRRLDIPDGSRRAVSLLVNDRTKQFLLKCLMWGAFYPNYITSSPLEVDKLKSAKQTFPAFDPLTCVIVDPIPAGVDDRTLATRLRPLYECGKIVRTHPVGLRAMVQYQGLQHARIFPAHGVLQSLRQFGGGGLDLTETGKREDISRPSGRPRMYGNEATRRRDNLSAVVSPARLLFRSLATHEDVSVDSDSVCAAVVAPYEDLTRVGVCTFFQRSDRSRRTFGRECTLLPADQPYLHHLLLLIFSPSVRMLTNRRKNKYIGANCGGDIKVTFSHHISAHDLRTVNTLRQQISSAVLGSCDGQSQQRRQHPRASPLDQGPSSTSGPSFPLDQPSDQDWVRRRDRANRRPGSSPQQQNQHLQGPRMGQEGPNSIPLSRQLVDLLCGASRPAIRPRERYESLYGQETLHAQRMRYNADIDHPTLLPPVPEAFEARTEARYNDDSDESDRTARVREVQRLKELVDPSEIVELPRVKILCRACCAEVADAADVEPVERPNALLSLRMQRTFGKVFRSESSDNTSAYCRNRHEVGYFTEDNEKIIDETSALLVSLPTGEQIPWTAELCTNGAWQLRRLVQEHSEEDPVRPATSRSRQYYCTVCSKECRSRVELRSHLASKRHLQEEKYYLESYGS